LRQLFVVDADECHSEYQKEQDAKKPKEAQVG